MATTQRHPEPRQAEGATPTMAEAPERQGIAPLQGAWWKWGAGLLMAYVCYGAFFVARTAVNFPADTNRILFFHVPGAILSYVGYFAAAVYSVQYLTKKPHLHTDTKALASMELGFLFCILATVTGSFFSRAVWGSYWNWDPRQTSILVMLLLYAAYLVLRGAVTGQPEKRARLSAVYVIASLIPATFLIWVVPRLPALLSLHPPDTVIRNKMSADHKAVFYPAAVAFTLLYVWMFQLRCRMVTVLARRARRANEPLSGEPLSEVVQ